MAGGRAAPFRSRIDGFRAAIEARACKACFAIDRRRGIERGKWACPECGATEPWRLFSKAETQRFAELVLLQRQGQITRLVCQPRIPLKVNGTDIGAYVADFCYITDAGKVIYEDVKPPQFRTELSTLKMKLARAIYGPVGFTLNVIER